MNLLGGLGMKLAAGVAALALVGNIAQYIQVRLVKAELKEADAALVIAKSVNQTNIGTIKELKAANENWAATAELKESQIKELKKDAENAKRVVANVRSELEARRANDRKAPDCAALLDRPLSICPDVVKRLFERQSALGADRDG